jgi:hypothetical protein
MIKPVVPFVSGVTVERWLASPVTWVEWTGLLVVGMAAVVCLIMALELIVCTIKSIWRVKTLYGYGNRYEQTMLVRKEVGR